MSLDLSQLLLFSVLTSSLHWLIARSEIAKPFWSRTSGWLGKLLACAGCSGFWLGAVLGGTEVASPVTLYVAHVLYVDVALRALVHGVLGVFVTPVFESVLLWGLQNSAVDLGDAGDDTGDETEDVTGSVPKTLASTRDSELITPNDNFLHKKP